MYYYLFVNTVYAYFLDFCQNWVGMLYRMFICLLLLPRLGLWSRDKAAKGTAVVATEVVGRIDVTATEEEGVGGASARVGSRRPVITALASAVEQLIARIDIPAPHKEERTKSYIIRITIN